MKSSKIIALSALMLTAVFSVSHAAYVSSDNLIENGSFENIGDNNFNKRGWGIFDSIPSWQVEMGYNNIEIQSNKTLSTIDAQKGYNYAELESDGISSFFQEFTPVVNGNHILQFWYSPRRDEGMDGNMVNATLNGTTVASISGPDGVTEVGKWTMVEATLNDLIAGETYSLGFNADGTKPNFTYGGFVDNVSVTAVPVPAAGILFGSALLGMFGVMRRRPAATA